MTAWQHLRLVSPLSDGHTAWEHLVAIQLGVGSGQTIFCSQRTAIFEQDEATVTRKPKRKAPAETPVAQPTSRSDKQQRDIVVIFSQPSVVVLFDGPDEMTITQRTERMTVTSRPDEQVVRRKTKRT